MALRFGIRLYGLSKNIYVFKARNYFFISVSGASEWREVLVDVDSETGGLRFVRSRHETPATALIDPELKPPQDEEMGGVEISPKASSIVSAMSQRIDEFGGAALIGDYGNDYAPSDTFRGFRYNILIDNF